MRRWSWSLFAGLAGAVLATPAAAINLCTFSTVGVNFGNYNVFSAGALTANGTVTYRCLGVGGESITIDLSQGTAPSFNPRTMSQSGEVLNYNLYLDAAATQIWGNGTAGSQRYGPLVPPNNQTVNVTIFGRIPPGQDVTVGSYTDTIIATINF
jgi:spore coat protein U-like protein